MKYVPNIDRNNKEKRKQLEGTSTMKKIALIALVAIGTLIPALSFAGARGGALVCSGKVAADATDVYSIVFNGGEQAHMELGGDGNAELELYVYDENNNLIFCDVGSGEACVWIPRWTGKFTVKIKNRGSVHHDYMLATN